MNNCPNATRHERRRSISVRSRTFFSVPVAHTPTHMRSLGIHPNQQQHMRVCLASARPENSTHAFRSARMHAISLDLSGQLPLRKFRIECNLQQCDAQFTVVVPVVSCCPTPHPFRLPPVPQSRWHSDSATANRSPRLFSLYGAVLVVIARPNASACVCAHTHILGSYFKATCFLHCCVCALVLSGERGRVFEFSTHI